MWKHEKYGVYYSEGLWNMIYFKILSRRKNYYFQQLTSELKQKGKNLGCTKGCWYIKIVSDKNLWLVLIVVIKIDRVESNIVP
jgi:hypothetical protein